MRILGAGHVAFAATMAWLGVLGLVHSDLAPIWQPSPKDVPARVALAVLCGVLSLACGVGLLWRRSAALAARVLLVYLLLWFVLFRVSRIFVAPAAQDTWSGCGETAVLVAGAWVLYAALAVDGGGRPDGPATGDTGVRIGRALYGLALIPFGLAHFRYLKETAGLVPAWLPGHLAWASFTGGAFLAAGVAVLTGVLARPAAALSTLQIGLFTLLVWVPVLANRPNAFQWSEFVISTAITAGAWAVSDSYRGGRWLAVRGS
jgi:hypothetical protein